MAQTPGTTKPYTSLTEKEQKSEEAKAMLSNEMRTDSQAPPQAKSLVTQAGSEVRVLRGPEFAAPPSSGSQSEAFSGHMKAPLIV